MSDTPQTPPAPEAMPEFTPPAQTQPAPAAAPTPKTTPPGTCPRCGSTDLGKGSIISYGTKFRPVYLRPSKLSFFRLHNMLRAFRGVTEVEAQVCRRCGYLMLQVDTEKLAEIERLSGDKA